MHIHSPQSLSGSSPLREMVACIRTAFPDRIGERNAVVVIRDGIDYRIGGQSLPSTPPGNQSFDGSWPCVRTRAETRGASFTERPGSFADQNPTTCPLWAVATGAS